MQAIHLVNKVSHNPLKSHYVSVWCHITIDTKFLDLYIEIAQTAHHRFWQETRAKTLSPRSKLKTDVNAKSKGEIFSMKVNKLVRKKFVALGAMLSLIAIVMGFTANARVAAHSVESNDIVDTAVAAGQFKTLAAALEAAGLIEALKGNGPFTVFAPTDEAFAKLPAGTVETLLKPENKEKLKAVLLYHVVPGNVTADQVTKLNGQSMKTLQGSSIIVKTAHGVRVDNANVIQTDIKASNGVIHVIDTVLMPKM